MNRTLLFSAACFLSMGLFAQTTTSPSSLAQGVDVNFESKEQETDMEALRRWLQDKRLVSLKELGGDLSVSGEVRSEMKYTNERLKAQGPGQIFIQQRYLEVSVSKF